MRLSNEEYLCGGLARTQHVDAGGAGNERAVLAVGHAHKASVDGEEIDDITYIPGNGIPDDIELQGYHLYCNGKMSQSSLIRSLSAKDTRN